MDGVLKWGEAGGGKPPVSFVAAASVLAVFLGAVGAWAQLGLLRESLGLTAGSEVAWGLTLAAWLVAGGVGSAAGSRLAPRLAPAWRPVAAAAGVVAAGGFYLLGLWLGWGARGLTAAAPGEVLGGVAGAPYFLAVTGPAAAGVGWGFACLARAYDGRRVYAWEAAGFFAAGVLFRLALWRWFDALALGVLVLAAAAAATACGAWAARGAARWAAAVLVLITAAGAALAGNWAPALERAWYFARAFPGERVVARRASPYGAVVVTARGDRYAVYENGVLVGAYPDALAAEETVVPPLLVRPAARRLVLFGGGINGALAEVARFPGVRAVTYVEPDAAVVAAARAAFDPAFARGPGVTFVAEDGRAWARRAAGEGVRADVVIVATAPPLSAQSNRFYTREFFADLKGILAPAGLLAFGVPGAANYYPPELAALLRTCRVTAASCYRHVAYLPGERFLFLASDGPLNAEPAALTASLARAGVRPRYVTPAFVAAEYSPDRLEAAARAAAGAGGVNTDLRPAGLNAGLALWARRLGGGEVTVLKAAARLRLWYIWAVLGAAAAALIAARRRVGVRGAVGAAAVAQGGAALALELLILLGFQATMGSAYLEVALVVGAFMAGSAAGALAPAPREGARAQRRMVGCLVLTGVAALLAPALTAAAGHAGVVGTAAARAAWTALAFAGGVAGGAFFVAALAAWGRRRAGALYAWDLFGAAAGAAVTAAVLVPAWGMVKAAATVAALAAAAAAVTTTAAFPEGELR